MKNKVPIYLLLTASIGWAFVNDAHATDPPIYVKVSATGANDGTSWADAFTNLHSALASARDGAEIWVAVGTYLPDVPNGSRAATFLIAKNVRLYGGFAGTETSLDQRGNPASHPTVLSGDLAGNDFDDNNPLNRLENVMTVLTVGTAITGKTVIDGFTITGGQADGPSGDMTGPEKSGGGMYALGHPLVRRCIFSGNYARMRGAGAYFKSTSGPVIEHCQFLGNVSGDWGGGLHVAPAGGSAEVRSSMFKNNEALRGGGAALMDQETILSSCIFLSNKATQHGGGLLYLAMERNDITVRVENCAFQENSSSLGGGVYMYGYVGRSGIRFEFAHCNFVGNKSVESAPGWGPAGGGGLIGIGSLNSSASVRGCSFSQNSSAKYGGGLGAMLYGTRVQFEIKDSGFLANTSGSESGALAIWGADDGYGKAIVENCLFENNTSGIGGAAGIGNGFNGSPGNFDFTLANCTWRGNQAKLAGALRLWGDPNSTSHFTMDNCLLENNMATFRGGAMALSAAGHFKASLGHSILRNNQSPRAGAMDISSFSYTGTTYPQNADFSMDNCLVAGNTGAHAAISSRYVPHLRSTNCTIAGNQGGGVQLANKSALTLQNTILYNPGFPEYEEGVGSPSFTSLGGNLIGDLSLDGKLTASDKQNLDPVFSETGDYHLTLGSPCVDAGLDGGLANALSDLDGQPRIQGLRVDMGAFESPFLTAVREALSSEAVLSPNPASSHLRILLPENAPAQLDVQVFDTSGKLALRQPLGKRERLDINRLPAAVYSLRATAGGRVFTGRFIKQ